MAWEKADILFPTGFISTPQGIISVEDLKQNNLPIVQMESVKMARNMLTQGKIYTWGADGEAAINIMYDVLTARPHAQDESPTNVYGMAMLYNFYHLNNIQFDRNFGMHEVGKTAQYCNCN